MFGFRPRLTTMAGMVLCLGAGESYPSADPQVRLPAGCYDVGDGYYDPQKQQVLSYTGTDGLDDVEARACVGELIS